MGEDAARVDVLGPGDVPREVLVPPAHVQDEGLPLLPELLGLLGGDLGDGFQLALGVALQPRDVPHHLI